MSQWIGRRKIAFIPVFRPQIDAVPQDWEAQIQARLYFDPIVLGDSSLRTYIHKTSYGRADLEGVVLPRVAIDRIEVKPDALADRTDSLKDQGFDAAALVMLGGLNTGTAELGGFWARFAMLEKVGVWAMELIHVVTGYSDLYNNLSDSSDWWFDNMACACGTHPSAFTKERLGWLDPSAIARHSGRVRAYDLHTLALVQPPPSGRYSAVRVGSKDPFLMIEGRQKIIDQFDGLMPSEGVIVYEVLKSDDDPDPELTRPTVLLRTPVGLSLGQTFASSSGVTVRVTDELAGGFSIRVQDPSQHLVDRTLEFGTPAAAGRPTATVIPGLGVHNIAYRDTSGRLHELWRDAQGATGTTDLTASANAQNATGNPLAYTDTRRNTEILLYQDSAGVVRSLYWSTAEVGADDLSGTAGSPNGVGTAVGYYIASSDTHHVVYRTANGDLHELNWSGTSPVTYGGNLTGTISAPAAAGEPTAFANGAGVNIVAYRTSDGRILGLYWAEGPSGLDHLSEFADTPPAAGDPFGYYTPGDDVSQIVYVGDDGHVWELYWLGASPVVGWDVSLPSGAPPAAGTPAAYYNSWTNTKHVIYRSADLRLHELAWKPGTSEPGHWDLTTFASAPLAEDDPVAFVDADGVNHVVYRAGDNHIYEIIW